MKRRAGKKEEIFAVILEDTRILCALNWGTIAKD